MPRPSPITPEQKLEVLRLYEEGYSRNALVERFNTSRGFMSYFLKDSGANFRDGKNANVVQLPNGVNPFAEAENKPDAAYWTGFLMADGCISIEKRKRAPGIICQLQASDGPHLEKLSRFFGWGNVVYGTKEEHGFARISVYQQQIADTLVGYGVTPRKSKTATVCHSLAMNVHFWRGVIDGDGSLQFRVRGNYQAPILHLCGSQFLMRQYAEFVRFHSTAAANPFFSSSVWNVQISSQSAVYLVRLLYGVGGVSLDRKQAIADRILSMTWKTSGHRR